MHTKPGTYTGGEGPKCFNSYFHFLLQLVFVYYVDMVQIVDMLREYLTCAGRGGGGGGGGSSDGYQDMDELEKLAGKLSLSETSKQVCVVMHRFILQLLALLLTHPLLLLPPPPPHPPPPPPSLTSPPPPLPFFLSPPPLPPSYFVLPG